MSTSSCAPHGTRHISRGRPSLVARVVIDQRGSGWLASIYALCPHCHTIATAATPQYSTHSKLDPSSMWPMCLHRSLTNLLKRNLDRTYLTCRVRVATLSAQLHPRLHDTNTRRYSKHDLLVLCATSPTLATMIHLTVCGQHWPPYQLRLSSV